ncbi:non-heme iron oxygenase ferredoxin subunit [Thiolapillus sp.]
MENEWLAVAVENELSPGQMKRITAGNKRLLLCNADDSYYVVDEMCSHEDYSLFLGCIQDGRIKCSLHGSYFDLKSGAPETEPANQPICTYPVKKEGGQIWVLPRKQE